jgi:hypothetical protein
MNARFKPSAKPVADWKEAQVPPQDFQNDVSKTPDLAHNMVEILDFHMHPSPIFSEILDPPLWYSIVRIWYPWTDLASTLFAHPDTFTGMK